MVREFNVYGIWAEKYMNHNIPGQSLGLSSRYCDRNKAASCRLKTSENVNCGENLRKHRRRFDYLKDKNALGDALHVKRE